MESRRLVLLSAKIQFSPETQPIKETAIDKIVEQGLLLSDDRNGLTVRQMEAMGVTALPGGPSIISRKELERSLDRLVEANRVTVMQRGSDRMYRLSDAARDESLEIQKAVENRFDKTVKKLFVNATEGHQAYAGPFLAVLCTAFSRIGASYVRLLKGDLDVRRLMSLANVDGLLVEMRTKDYPIDHDIFRQGVYSFFQEDDPEYVAIKWNMAQNYYIAHALKLREASYLLSREAFSHATFFVDTNILIQALNPKSRHYGSFKTVSDACSRLNLELRVCRVTLSELDRVISNNRRVIPRVDNQIPNGLVSRIDNDFFRLYRERQESTGSQNLEEIFASFDEPENDLNELYGVEIVDDQWFDNEKEASATLKLSEVIVKEYQLRRKLPKTELAGVHDALMMRWIAKGRGENQEAWFLTLDTTLPGIIPEEAQAMRRTLAITLDALLQWISPIAITGANEEEVAKIFSEAVRFQLLPQENLLDLRDFLMLSEMEMECRELPAEDVENCIRYIKKEAPNLDTSNPKDREKLAHELRKFFASTERKYKQNVQSLESQLKQKNREIDELGRAHDQKIRSLSDRITGMEIDIQARDMEKAIRSLRYSALIRISIALAVSIAYEVLIGYISIKHGEGINTFQKLLRSWVLIALGLPIWILLSWLFAGEERISALGKPFNKIFKK